MPAQNNNGSYGSKLRSGSFFKEQFTATKPDSGASTTGRLCHVNAGGTILLEHLAVRTGLLLGRREQNKLRTAKKT